MANGNNYYTKHLEDTPRTPYNIKDSDISQGKRKAGNTCQYWVKGMPAVCKYWEPGDPGNCTYERLNNKGQRIYPSGWNGSRCDFLGRRYECDRYEASGEDNLDQYICVAPNPFISGLTRDTDNGRTAVAMTPEGQDARGIDRYVWGYNPDSDFVGQCDGCGLGKGSDGYSLSCSSPQMGELPVICNYYRPWHMGFGAKEPKTTDINRAKVDKETGRIIGDERDEMQDRLPLSFKIYNIRAKVQKCAYWDADQGSEFVLDSAGLYLESGDLCINPDEAAEPYHTQSPNSPPADMLLTNVWAEAGCIICNGAREGCPGYTGKWIYCLDDKLEKGDKVSGQQILELRFWMLDWASQKEYDSVFKKPPNKDDPSTSSIRTYGRWVSISTDPYDSILIGKELNLCVPSQRYEFTTDHIQVDKLTYETPKGTHSPANGRVSFPSLVRDVEHLNVPPLNIIYPYSTKDPFDAELNPICGDQDSTPCIKRNFSIEGDEVTVVGSTVRNKDIYAFNANIVGYGEIRQLIEEYNSIELESYAQKREFKYQIKEFIDTLRREHSESLYTAESDSNGTFYIGPVKLNYQELNELIICLEVDGDWLFRKRSVWSQWHGGTLLQCDSSEDAFKHEYEQDTTYIDDGYQLFTPSAAAAGRLMPMEGVNIYDLSTEVLDLMNAGSAYIYSGVAGFYYNYNYCIKKTENVGVEVTRWKRVGNAGHLWIEIDDLNLNYVFDWGVTNARAYIENEDGSVEESIEMEKVFPTGSYTQDTVHPNACIIAPKGSEKVGFYSSDGWTVEIDYWYNSLSNDSNTSENTSIAYPDLDSETNRFADSVYNISLNKEEFTVSNIIKDSVSLIAMFSDEEGRLISTMASKLCVSVARTLCRDVEIYYNWFGDCTRYKLRPESGFLRIDQDGPFRLESVGSDSRGSNIPCGDHQLGAFSNTGPMWFPYDSCLRTDYYDVYTGANTCTMPHEDTPRYDYRFRGPDYNVPFASPHSTLWDCAEDWAVGHSELEPLSVRFTGYAKKRGYINAELYRAFGWTLPKFGNVLREYVERFISIDNASYLSMKTETPTPSYAWMPFVMDNDMFFLDFNCIDGNEINFVTQLNFWKANTDVSEKVDRSGPNIARYDFNSVFNIRRTILASYPDPILTLGSTYSFVAYYNFVNENYQWAWQEEWAEIERSSDDGAVAMYFVNLSRPDYIFDLYKEEHKFIADEGTYDLVFTPPTIDKSNGVLDEYPSIRLGAGEQRWFDILYPESEYEDHGLVDWKNESKTGTESIYKVTTVSGEWIHAYESEYPDYYNMIYDSEATDDPSQAEDDDRKIVVDYDAILEQTEEYVYNRGAVANIYKDRLKYMPYDEGVLSATISGGVNNKDFPGAYEFIADSGSLIFDFAPDTQCVSRVVVRGYRGNTTISGIKYHVNQPGISIYEKVGSTWSSVLATRTSLYLNLDEQGSEIGLSTWEEGVDIDVLPTRMITDRANALKISFSNLPRDEDVISIQSIEIYGAEYKSHTEKIKLWERKYNISKGKYGNFNPDGINRVLSYEQNRDNSGIYFNEYIANALGFGSDFSSYNKIRRLSGEEHKDDEESMVVYNYNTVVEAEAEQQVLYETALGQEGSDVVKYTTVTPPNMELFLDEVGAGNRFDGINITVESDKMQWGNKSEVGDYEVYDVWYPGGHRYEWDDELRQARCYIVAPFSDLMKYRFDHVHADFGEEAATGVVAWYGVRPYYMESKFLKNSLLGNDASQKLGDGSDAHVSPYVRR